MLTYNELFQANAQIPEEWYETVRKAVIGVVDLRLTGRDFFDVLQVPADQEQFSYDRHTDVSDAALTAKGSEISRDVVAIQRGTFDIPQISKGYYIHRIDAMRRQYVNLSVRRAARKVAEGLDQLLFLGTVGGIAAPTVVGIDGASVSSTATTGDWGAVATDAAEIYEDVNVMLKDLETTGTAGSSPTLILNSTQFGEARKLNINTDENSLTLIREGLGVEVRRAYAPAVPDGTAYMIGDTGPDIMQVVIAEDVTTERAAYNLERQSFLGNIFVRMLPVIYQYGAGTNESEYIRKMTAL